MATIKINNADSTGRIKNIECPEVKGSTIHLIVNVSGENLPIALQINDAQLLQSWLFYNVKKIKQNG